MKNFITLLAAILCLLTACSKGPYPVDSIVGEYNLTENNSTVGTMTVIPTGRDSFQLKCRILFLTQPLCETTGVVTGENIYKVNPIDDDTTLLITEQKGDVLSLILKVKVYDAGKVVEKPFYLTATKQHRKKNS